MAIEVGIEEQTPSQASPGAGSELQEKAKRHLWMHFTRMGAYDDHEVPVIARGEGCYVFDEHGNRYLDGLAALFCVNAGHGRKELGEAAKRRPPEEVALTGGPYGLRRTIVSVRVNPASPYRVSGQDGRRTKTRPHQSASMASPQMKPPCMLLQSQRRATAVHSARRRRSQASSGLKVRLTRFGRRSRV